MVSQNSVTDEIWVGTMSFRSDLICAVHPVCTSADVNNCIKTLIHSYILPNILYALTNKYDKYEFRGEELSNRIGPCFPIICVAKHF